MVRLAREIWPEHYAPIIGRAQVEYMLERFQSARAVGQQLLQGAEYYLVTHGGCRAGYTAVVPDADAAELMLSKIYVRKRLRGLGVGREILGFVEDLCVQRRFTKIWLTVNRNNVRSIEWYARMGFRNAGSIVREIGGGFVMDDWKLEKAV